MLNGFYGKNGYLPKSNAIVGQERQVLFDQIAQARAQMGRGLAQHIRIHRAGTHRRHANVQRFSLDCQDFRQAGYARL